MKNSDNKSFVSCLNYQLGEKKYECSQAIGYKEVVAKANMPELPDLWGWGQCFETEDIYALAISSVQKTLEVSGLNNKDINLIIFASSYFTGPFSKQNASIGRFLHELNLEHCDFFGVTLQGCVSALQAMNLSSMLVAAGRVSRVLVVVLESLGPKMNRFSEYGVFSDASVSFLVSNDLVSDFELISVSQNKNVDAMISGTSLENGLQKNIYKNLLDSEKLEFNDVGKIFGNNVFLPIKTLKEKKAGFTKDQFFLNNVPRTGHCFGCDAFINLSDYINQGGITRQSYYVLQADADGHDVAFLLKAI